MMGIDGLVQWVSADDGYRVRMMGIDGLVQWVSADDGYRWVGSMGECG